jgi:hypothetical protein
VSSLPGSQRNRHGGSLCLPGIRGLRWLPIAHLVAAGVIVGVIALSQGCAYGGAAGSQASSSGTSTGSSDDEASTADPVSGFPLDAMMTASGSSTGAMGASGETAGSPGDPSGAVDDAADVPDSTSGAMAKEAGTPDASSGAPVTSASGSNSGAASGAPVEAGPPKCGHNFLTPTTATASSVSTTNTANVAPNAVDGMLSTRWESVQADPQWLDVDFGAPVFIGEVDILWEAACAKNYDLEISSNGTTWTTIPNGTISGNTTAASVVGANPTPPTDWSKAVVTKPLAASGRYLRMNGTVRCTTYGYSIWELRAYGDKDASCAP